MSIEPPKSVGPPLAQTTHDAPIDEAEQARIAVAFAARAATTTDELPGFLTRLQEHDSALVDAIRNPDRRFIDYVHAHAAKTYSR